MNAGREYSDAKAAAEAVVMAAAKRGILSAVTLRPTIVYGPFSSRPRSSTTRGWGDQLVDGGRGLCNAVYVDDVCDAIMAALYRDDAFGEVFLVTAIPGSPGGTSSPRLPTWLTPKVHHDHSLEEIAAYWQARGHAPATFHCALPAWRLAGVPCSARHHPSVGRLIRGTRSCVASRITGRTKGVDQARLQGRRAAAPPDHFPRFACQRRPRGAEAYKSWVSISAPARASAGRRRTRSRTEPRAPASGCASPPGGCGLVWL